MKSQISGAVIIDKPEKLTSHDVVDCLRKIFNEKSIGHAGTLDPLATGLLVCLIGEGTKLSQFVMDEEKSYQVTALLGTVTNTGDITGKTLSTADSSGVTLEAVHAAVENLVGSLELQVPQYSAIKVAGKKLYEYARSEEVVELPVRSMIIHKAQVLTFKPGQKIDDGQAGQSQGAQVEILIDCAKGTYVRSWVSKLGEILGVGATVSQLKRLSSGPFNLEKSYSLEALEQKKLSGELESTVIPLGEVLSTWPALRVLDRDYRLVRNGQIPHGIVAQTRVFNLKSGLRLIDDRGNLLALAVKDPHGGLRLGRVFH